MLTAETLRTDLLDLWSEGRMPIKSILIVTHNIEEAVLARDRILVFSTNPAAGGHRDRRDLAPAAQSPGPLRSQGAGGQHLCPDDGADRERASRARASFGTGIRMALPRVSTNTLAGLMEAVAAEPYLRPRARRFGSCQRAPI